MTLRNRISVAAAVGVLVVVAAVSSVLYTSYAVSLHSRVDAARSMPPSRRPRSPSASNSRRAMIAINVQGLLYTTRAALPHLLKAAEDGQRRVADIVNISSIAGRVAWNGYGVYNLTKFGVNGFTEALRQEVTQRHVRVGVLEPGGVATELGSHNKPEIRDQMIDPFYQQTEVLAPEDIADGIAYMITRPRHTAIGELWIMPTDQI